MLPTNEEPVRFASASGYVSAAIGVLIVLGWLLAEMLLVKQHGARLTSVRDDFHTMVVEWSIVAILAAIAFGWQQLSPRLFRLRGLGWLDLLFTFGALAAALVLSGVISRLVTAPKFDLHRMASVPFSVRVGLVLTAGICEEFIFRGFVLEELGMLTGSRWLGAFLSLAIFSIGHAGVYGFSSALLIPASVGLVLTLLYMFRKSLPACILMHAAMDALVLLAIPALVHG